MKSAFFYTFLLFLFATPATAQQLWENVPLPGGPPGPWTLNDIDADSDLDLFGVGPWIEVTSNSFPGDWTVQQYDNPLPTNIQKGAFADFNNDGLIDAVYSGTTLSGPHIGWIENLGDWEFEAHVIHEFNEGGPSRTLSAGDIDGDGDNDFIVSDGITGLWVYFNDGAGNFSADVYASAYRYVEASNLADFNGDGLLDFAAYGPGGDPLNLYIAQPDTSYDIFQLTFNPDRHFMRPVAIDFDHDGDYDILASDYHTDLTWRRVVWWENVDGTNLDEHRIYTFNPLEPLPLTPLDVDNDGDTDVAYGNQILVNSGDNLTFTGFQYGEAFVSQDTQLASADIDGDGDMDILNQEVRWFVNPYISRRIEIGLDAMQTDVPANGGFITYHGALLNNMANPRYLRLWSTVTFPGGNESTVWSMRRVFQPDQVYEADTIQQYIPPAAPAGTYTFTVHFGDPDQLDIIGDSFQFEKHEYGRALDGSASRDHRPVNSGVD
ncbi:VCBS repeat-containing protein [bacterium]|nr:VCBS repeat-containing protein [bacterium]